MLPEVETYFVCIKWLVEKVLVDLGLKEVLFC